MVCEDDNTHVTQSNSKTCVITQPKQSYFDSPPHPLVNLYWTLIIPALLIHHSFTLSLQA